MANSNFRTLQVDYLAGINANRSYIRNGLALQGTTGYATYADTGDRPVDGTGGVANVTWTVTTTNPLRGESSFLFTKDAANRQGQGVSYLFTIDEADRAKVLQIEFDYAVNSGTYVTGDLTCYIVDVTNGTVIQPSAFQIENVGVNSTARLTFQTASNSTFYRLCFHVASTSSSAYSLKFDNIVLGPQVVPMGAPVTDWVTYAPTIGNLGTGSTVTNSGFWRRVGDSMQIIMKVTKDGSGGSGSLAVTFSLPSGYLIDTTKLPATSIQSVGYVTDGSGGTVGSVLYLTPTQVYLYAMTAGAGQWNGSAFTANKQITLNFMVPIVGWSSSTVVSSSADTRVVAFNYENTAGTSFTGGAGYADVPFASKSYDTHGAFSSPTFTAPVPGYYELSFNLFTTEATLSTTQAMQTKFVLTGASAGSYDGFLEYGNGASRGFNPKGRIQVWMNAGDTAKIQHASDVTVALNTTARRNYFNGRLIQGPSQIAASEVIAVNAYRSSTPQTIPNNSDTTIIFDVKEVDTHNAYNNTTGVFTAPAPGLYKFDAGVRLDLTIGTATNTYAYFQKQGSGVRAITYLYQDVTAGDVTLRPSDIIPLDTGQTVTVRAAQFSGGSGATSAIAWQTYLNIHRLGGVM